MVWFFSPHRRDKQTISVGQDGTDSDVTFANKDKMEVRMK